MNSLHAVGVGARRSLSVFPTACHSCGHRIDASVVEWCACISKLQSVVCQNCGACSCRAPLPYQLTFWTNMPSELVRERIRRSRSASVGSASPGVVPSSLMKRPLVLVVENDLLALKSATAAIAKLGYGYITARNGVEAIRMVHQERPEIVLADALMPVMDGRQLCRLIKADDRTRHIKVVIMTALYRAATHKYESLHEFGADKYLYKPLKENELATAIEELTSKIQATAAA